MITGDKFDIGTSFRYNITTTGPGNCLITDGASV
jgi:hypothetical protein